VPCPPFPPAAGGVAGRTRLCTILVSPEPERSPPPGRCSARRDRRRAPRRRVPRGEARRQHPEAARPGSPSVRGGGGGGRRRGGARAGAEMVGSSVCTCRHTRDTRAGRCGAGS
jgi:hypothetical protein